MARKVVYEETSVVDNGALMPMSGRDLITTLLIGAGVGLVFGISFYLLNKFIFGAVLCRPQAPADCSQAPLYAFIVAMVIGVIAGLVSLVRMRVYRPLLAVLAATIALWGVHELVLGAKWYWGLLALMLLFGLAYALFTWLSRIRSLIIALIAIVIAVVVVRLFLI